MGAKIKIAEVQHEIDDALLDALNKLYEKEKEEMKLDEKSIQLEKDILVEIKQLEDQIALIDKDFAKIEDTSSLPKVQEILEDANKKHILVENVLKKLAKAIHDQETLGKKHIFLGELHLDHQKVDILREHVDSIGKKIKNYFIKYDPKQFTLSA